MPSAANPDFFAEAHAASISKIEILEKYLRPLTYKWGSGWRTIWVLDGFAGQGAYQPDAGGRIQPGSPLVAAQWAREIELHRGHPLLHTINVERDGPTFDTLRRHLAPYQALTTNLHGEFEARLDEVLAMTGRDPAFFFLDPFGVNGIEIELIERILRRPSRKTELLIHFSDRSFKRMAGHLADNVRKEVGHKVAEAKLAQLDAVIGTPLWRRIWEAAPDTDAAIDQIAKLYRAQLAERGVRYAHEIRMRDAYADRPRYRLIFGTGSTHGVELMSDIACRYERELFDAAHEGSFELIWEEQRRVSALGALRDSIYEYGLEHHGCTPDEIGRNLSVRFFGEYTRTDYNEAIRRLVKEGAIDRGTAKGIKPDEPLRFVVRSQQSLLGG